MGGESRCDKCHNGIRAPNDMLLIDLLSCRPEKLRIVSLQ